MGNKTEPAAMEMVNDLGKFIHLNFSWPRSEKRQTVKVDGYAVYVAKNGRACEPVSIRKLANVILSQAKNLFPTC